MHNSPPAPPPHDAPKRRQIDGTAIARALAEQQRRDADAEPATLLTTMGAVRLLGDLILDRRGRGWSDAKLVALLRELGVEISAETLRVYRGRLKAERSRDRGTADSEATPPSTPARDTSRVGSRPEAQIDDSAPAPSLAPARKEPEQPRMDAGKEPLPPPFSRSIDFDDRV